MSEQSDKDSKTEEPTEKKIRDTVEKGQLPSSRELSTLFSIGAFIFYFVFMLRGWSARSDPVTCRLHR